MTGVPWQGLGTVAVTEALPPAPPSGDPSATQSPGLHRPPLSDPLAKEATGPSFHYVRQALSGPGECLSKSAMMPKAVLDPDAAGAA